MYLSLCLSLGLLAGPPQKAPERGSVIVVSGKVLRIPELPVDGRTASGSCGKVQKEIAENIRDLETSLPREPLPAPAEGFRIPATERVEAEALRAILEDREGQELFEVFRARLDLYASLATGRLKAPESGTAPSPEDAAVIKEVQRRLALAKLPPSQGDKVMDWLLAPSAPVGAVRRISPQGPELGGISGLARRMNREAQRSLAVRNALAPNLAEAWAPLISRVEAQARFLADLEARPVSADSELGRMRACTRYQFQMKCRELLWCAGAVWGYLANAAPLPPLASRS